jgi:transcription elongation factor Elf1
VKITDKCPKCGQQLTGKILTHLNILAIDCANCGWYTAINTAPTTKEKE